MSDIDTILVEVDPSLVPEIIQEQFDKLNALKENVDESVQKAEHAQESAKNAKKKSAGIFKRKETIKNLQSTAIDIAEAQISVASTQQASFEYQQKLGEIAKYLFGLGVSNIALNRSVVRELELRLNGASEEELDELARNEIVSVVKQLKAQEDIMKKQDNLMTIVREHDISMKEFEEREEEQDTLLEFHTEKVEEYELRLKEQDLKNKDQDQEIIKQARIDREHDEKLKALSDADESGSEEISKLKKDFCELENKVHIYTETIERLQSELDRKMETKTARVFDVIALVVSLTALAMILIHILK